MPAKPATQKQVGSIAEMAARFKNRYDSNLYKMLRVVNENGQPVFTGLPQAQVVIGKAVAIERIIYADPATVRQCNDILKAAAQKAAKAAAEANAPVAELAA